MRLQGYICRMWKQEAGCWTSTFERYKTEEEAHDAGRFFLTLIGGNETAREYEVYADWV